MIKNNTKDEKSNNNIILMKKQSCKTKEETIMQENHQYQKGQFSYFVTCGRK